MRNVVRERRRCPLGAVPQHTSLALGLNRQSQQSAKEQSEKSSEPAAKAKEVRKLLPPPQQQWWELVFLFVLNGHSASDVFDLSLHSF